MTNWDNTGVTPEHAEHLESQAITPDAAHRLGIRSLTKVSDLPAGFENYGERVLPALLFPWTDPDGVTYNQIKLPEEAAQTLDSKYLWRKGGSAPLGVFRSKAEPIPGETYEPKALIVEGTKQSVAASIHAPRDWEVYGIAGCRNWSQDSVPTHHLEAFDGKAVAIILDADAATNLDVYTAGMKLREALLAAGAEDVVFPRLPTSGTAGLDDYLAGVSPERRQKNLGNILRLAKKGGAKQRKPADAAPKPKLMRPEHPAMTAVFDSGGEKVTQVILTGNARSDIHRSLDAVKNRWDGRKIFNYGGAITRFKDGKLIPQTTGAWKNTLVEAADFCAYNSKGDTLQPTTPSPFILDASYARSEAFTTLEGIKHAPFVRNDGTVCTKKGYDPASKILLHPSEDLEEMEIPDHPTPDQIRESRETLEDWLYDFFRIMPTPADQANLLGLVLTPFIRLLLPSCPMAVINGLQMGVGKNLLADGISLLYNGTRVASMQLVLDDEEQRKQLTASFSEGQDFFLYDEAHVLQGKPLASALTASTWSDRQLGKTLRVEYPNQAVWIALGNKVRVYGDIERRVYPINLKPDTPRPDMRPSSTFRHPDFRDFTEKNRAKLLRAVFTLIRAWFAAGKPNPSKGSTFGSFEVWEKTVGGILEHAGIRHFLENRMDFRSESTADTTYWEHHLDWLYEHFGDEAFTTGTVSEKMRQNPREAEYPPNLEDPTDKGYNRVLGMAYGGIQDRFLGKYQLVKSGTRARAVLWRVLVVRGDNPGGGGDNGGGGGNPPEEPTPTPPTDGGQMTIFDSLNSDDSGVETFDDIGEEYQVTDDSFDGEEDRVVYDPFAADEEEQKTFAEVQAYRELVWDVETASVDDLHSYEGQYVRLSGYQGDDDDTVVTTDDSEMVSAIEKSDLNIGHNLLNFDLVAAAKHSGLNYLDAASKSADLMIIERQVDPPGAKGANPRGYYGLDKIAKRLGHTGKSDDLKKLAKKHGGFDKIPQNDPEYVSYLKGDVSATKYVWDRRKEAYHSDPYIKREHEVAARLSYGPQQEGFRLDLDELHQRLADQASRKEQNFHKLRDVYGIPLVTPKGDPVKAPLATKPGKERVAELLKEMGAKYMRRTDKSNEISTNKENLEAAIEFYSSPERMRSRKIDPDNVDSDGIRDLCETIIAVTTERSVYGTIEKYRAGDRVYPKISPEQSSGRWSVTEPGLTVLGKRGGKWKERSVFLPDDGDVLIAVDLDQVDARAIAGHCQDPAYMALFEPGRDLHSEVAQMVFGRSDGEWRDAAKILGHGFNYGLGAKGAAAQAGVDLKVAEQFHREMTEQFPVLADWKKVVVEQAAAGDLLDNGFGRKMRPDADRAYTQGPALMGQGATRDILAEWVLNLDLYCARRVKAVVHDEIIFSVPADGWESYRDRILAAVPSDFKGVPITAGSSKPAASWGDCYNKE